MRRTLIPNLRAYLFISLALSLSGFHFQADAKPIGSLKGGDKAWFYNKSGSSVETVVSDLNSCANISQLAQGTAVDAAPDAANGLLNLAWTGLLSGGRTNIDVANCMSSRDYTRYEMNGESMKNFGKRLGEMSNEQLSAYFTSPTPPEGQAAPYEPNGLFHAQENSMTAAGTLPKLKPQQILPALLKFGGPLILNKKLPPKPISSSTKLDPTKTTLVARLNFDGKAGRFDRPDLLFVKRNPDTGDFVLDKKNKPTVFRIANLKEKDLVDGFQIFQAEPGQYALWQMNGRKQSEVTYTCLSTLAIELKAGEAIYLGDWTYSAEEKYGVTANGEAEANSALKDIDVSSSALQTVNYMNGADTPCTSVVGGGLQLYYFELP